MRLSGATARFGGVVVCLLCSVFVSARAAHAASTTSSTHQTLRAVAPTSTVIVTADVDSDGDGLSDRLELLFGTDPHNPDTDGDGFRDGVEVLTGHSPTSTVTAALLAKSIHVNIAKQELTQNVMGIPVIAHRVSTGLPTKPTPVGTFHVLNKNLRAWSTAAKLWMPYWMAFTNRGHGIHELPEWPNGHKEGQAHLGHKASHGCVRLGVGEAKAVYEWTPIGTPVIITAK